MSVKNLRKLLKIDLLEAQGALKMLDVVQMKLILSKEKKVEEILTAIRVIKGVATVSQAEPMTKTPSGNRTMEVLVTFDSGDMEVLDYIDSMARVAKRIDDVITIVIRSLNDQPVRDAAGQKKLVY